MRRLHPLILAGLLAACGTTESISGGPHPDAGTDTHVDTAPDTAPDTPADPGTDSPPGACGAGGGECPPGRFCELPPGCDPSAPGTCVELGDGDCSTLYAPECGCDGITYGNACMRRYSGESMLHPGECGSDACAPWLDPCPEGETCEVPPGMCDMDGVTGTCMPIRDDCGFMWAPECGCDGVTYANVCERMRARAWIDHPGECGPDCGPDGLPSCDDGSFCEWPSGSCGEWGVGECMTVPEGCFDYEDPVCGCDGSTYSNDCYRQRAGVSLLHHGPC